MAYIPDVHTITWADGEIFVYFDKQFIGKLELKNLGKRTLYMVGEKSYDRINSAARELVKREKGLR